MKWVTLICLLLCSIVTESRHFHKRDADHHTQTIAQISTTIGQNNLDLIMLAMLAENFQKCELEELLKTVKKFREFAQHCVDDETGVDCGKSLITLFHDEVCKHEHLDESYPWTTECCAKKEPDREQCFHDHRDIPHEHYTKPNVEFVCKELKENPDHEFKYYIYRISRSHSSLYPPSVMTLAKQYQNVGKECCEAEEKEKCFETKLTEIHKNIHYLESKQKQVCNIISKFPYRVYFGIKLARIAQKYPGLTFEFALQLTTKSVAAIKDCCEGGVVGCMLERLELNKHICEEQEKISPLLKDCCAKPIMERTPCIYSLPNGEVPADLPDEVKEFIEDEHVCQHFADDKDKFLAKFHFEYSKKHQNAAIQTVMRVSKGYEGLLTKCCAEEHLQECLKIGPQLLEAGIKQAQELTKQTCEAYKNLGDVGYTIHLIGLYVKRIPQASDDTLLEIAGKLTAIAGKCCALPKDQTYVCAEDKLELLLGDLCEREQKTYINEQAHRCCVGPYVDRRVCITTLGLDPNYQIPKFDLHTLRVGGDICEGSEQEQLKKRLKILCQLLKMKPELTKEKKMNAVAEFTKLREKCCAEENHDLCLDRERPALLLKLETELND